MCWPDMPGRRGSHSTNAFGWSTRPSLSAAPTRVAGWAWTGACRRSPSRPPQLVVKSHALTMRPRRWLLGCANSNTSQRSCPTRRRIAQPPPGHCPACPPPQPRPQHSPAFPAPGVRRVDQDPRPARPRRPQRVRDAGQPPARTSDQRRRLGRIRPTGALQGPLPRRHGRARRPLVPVKPDLLLRVSPPDSGVPSLTHWLRISVCSSSTVAPVRSDGPWLVVSPTRGRDRTPWRATPSAGSPTPT